MHEESWKVRLMDFDALKNGKMSGHTVAGGWEGAVRHALLLGSASAMLAEAKKSLQSLFQMDQKKGKTTLALSVRVLTFRARM